jgi:general secretion pathway protein G
LTSKLRQGFTLIEIVFVLVIVAILGMIAIPRFMTTRDDASETQAKMTVTAVRTAISIEQQQRLLNGDYSAISRLSLSIGVDVPIFDFFDNDAKRPVLRYPLYSCIDASARECWIAMSDTKYLYRMPLGGSVVFMLQNNRFVCDESTENCKKLSR